MKYYRLIYNWLKEFILNFKSACEDETLIKDLFSQAELD